MDIVFSLTTQDLKKTLSNTNYPECRNPTQAL